MDGLSVFSDIPQEGGDKDLSTLNLVDILSILGLEVSSALAILCVFGHSVWFSCLFPFVK